MNSALMKPPRAAAPHTLGATFAVRSFSSAPLRPLSTLPHLNRHQIRARVMQAYYATLTSGSTHEVVYKQLLADDYEQLRKLGAPAKSVEALDRLEPASEDAAFLRDLFFGAIRRQEEHELRLTPLLENWELSRVALIDRILLVMGVEELLFFPEIPVKVTLNEYLDLAREYSTDKSSQFVNGILDKVLRTAQAKGDIQKRGKGLLDTAVLS
jgi:transcription antitermination factor NusB